MFLNPLRYLQRESNLLKEITIRSTELSLDIIDSSLVDIVVFNKRMGVSYFILESRERGGRTLSEKFLIFTKLKASLY